MKINRVKKILHLLFILIFLFLSVYLPAETDTQIPPGTGAFLQNAGATGLGDQDFIGVIFFEVPNALTTPLYFAIYDPEISNNYDTDAAGAGTSSFYLVGGSGAYSSENSRRIEHKTPLTVADALDGTILEIREYTAADAGFNEKWDYFGAVSADQGELIGTKRYFKIVVNISSGTRRNGYKLDVSLNNIGIPTGIADVKTFAFSWPIDANTAGETFNIYPYVPSSLNASDTHLWAYHYDFDTAAELGASTLILDNGTDPAVALTNIGGDGPFSQSLAIDADKGKSWIWTLVSSGTLDNNCAEVYFVLDGSTAGSGTQTVVRSGAGVYTYSAADYIYAAAESASVAVGGQVKVNFQVVDSSGNMLPEVVDIDIRTIINGNLVSGSNLSGTTLTTDSMGTGWILVDATGLAGTSIDMTFYTDGTNSTNLPNVTANSTVSVDIVSRVPPTLRMAATLEIEEGSAAACPDIIITEQDGTATRGLSNGDTVTITIPAGLNANFNFPGSPSFDVDNLDPDTVPGGSVSSVTIPNSKLIQIVIDGDFSKNDYIAISNVSFTAVNAISTGRLELKSTAFTDTVISAHTISVVAPVLETTWTGINNQNTGVPGNWTAGTPSSGINAIIPEIAVPPDDNPVANGAVNTLDLNIDVGGILTMNTNNLSVAGNLYQSGDLTMGAGTLLVDQDFYQSGIFTKTGGTLDANGNFHINGSTSLSGVTLDLEGDLYLNTSYVYDIGTLNSFVAGKFFYNNGVLVLDGAEDLTNLPRDIDSGKILYNGANTTLNYGLIYYDLEFNNAATTWTMDGSYTVNNDLTLTDGTLQLTGPLTIDGDLNLNGGTLDLNGYTLTVNGDVNITGTTISDTSGTGGGFTVARNWNQSTGSDLTMPVNTTVTFNNSSMVSQISGNTIWHNLTCTIASKVLVVEAASTQTINGAITLTGSSGSEIVLRSDDTGTTQFNLVNTGDSESISYVDISDCNATPVGVTECINCIDNVNNAGLVFNTTYTWTGGTGNWNLNTNWNPNGVPNSATDVVIIPDAAGNDVTLDLASVEVRDITIGAQASLDLNANDFTVNTSLANNGRLIIDGTETLNFPSNTIGGTVEYDGTTDASLYAGITTYADLEITGAAVWTSGQISVTNLSISSGAALDNNGDNIIVNTSLTNSGRLIIDGAGTLSLPGAITSIGGTVEYEGSTAANMLANVTDYVNLEFDETATWTAVENLSLSANLSIASAATLSPGTHTLSVGGNAQLANGITSTGADISITGTITLAGNINLSTGAGGGGITLSGNINGNAAGRTLSLTAGTGAVSLAAVGDSQALGSFTVVSAASISSGAITTSGNVSLTSAGVIITGLIETTTGDITLNSTGGAIGEADLITTDFTAPWAPVVVDCGGSLSVSAGEIAIESAGNITIANIEPLTDGGLAVIRSTGGNIVSHTGTLTLTSGDELGLVASGTITIPDVVHNSGATGILRFEAGGTLTDGTDGTFSSSWTADSLILESAGGLSLQTACNTITKANITAAGDFIVNQSGAISLVDIDTSAGNIQITASGSITIFDGVGSSNPVVAGGGGNNATITANGATSDILLEDADANIHAANGLITLTAGSNIVQTAGVQRSSSFALTAGGYIGSAISPVLTRAGNVEASAGGAIYISKTNLGALSIGGASALTGIDSSGSSEVWVNAANGEIIVDEGVSSAGGAVSLISAGTAPNITLNADINTGGTKGAVTLTSAGNILDGGGTVYATDLVLSSSGTIGTATVTEELLIEADNLEASASGVIYIDELDDVNVGGGTLSGINSGGNNAIVLESAGGSITISDNITAGTAQISVNASVNIIDGGGVLTSSGSILLQTSSGYIGQSGSEIQFTGSNLEAASGTALYLEKSNAGNLTVGGVDAGVTGLDANGIIELNIQEGLLTISEAVNSGGANAITLNAQEGITVGDNIIGTSTISLDADSDNDDSGAISQDAAGDQIQSASALSLHAGTGIVAELSGVSQLDADSNSGGITASQTSGTALALGVINCGAGNIDLDNTGAGSATTVESITASGQTVDINVGTTINDHSANTDLDIAAATLNITAPGGCGNSAVLEINATTNLTINTSGNDGNIDISDADAMVITDINAGAGDITINAGGNITRDGAGTHLACGGTLSITTSGNIGLITDVLGDLTDTGVYLPLRINIGSGSFTADQEIALNDVGAGVGPVSISQLTTNNVGTGRVLIEADNKNISQSALTGIETGDDVGFVADAGSITLKEGIDNNNLLLIANSGSPNISDDGDADVDIASSQVVIKSASAQTFTFSAAAGVSVDVECGGTVSMSAAGALTFSDLDSDANNYAAYTSSGNISVSNTSGVLILDNNGGSNEMLSAGTISLIASGAITLNGAVRAAGQIDIESNDNSGGTEIITINNIITNGSAANVIIDSDAGVSYTTAELITADGVKIVTANSGNAGTSGNPILTNADNLAANVDGALYVDETNGITINTVDGTSGITAGINAVEIESLVGDITVSQNINASGAGNKGAVTLTSAGNILDGGGTVYATDLVLSSSGTIGTATVTEELLIEADNLEASASGVIYIDELDDVNVGGGTLSGINSGGNNAIVLESAGGSITISDNITAGTARITLVAADNIIAGTGKLDADEAVLSATGGYIGTSTNKLSLDVGTVKAAANSNIYLTNTERAMTLQDPDAGTDALVSSGGRIDILIDAFTLTIAENISSNNGDIEIKQTGGAGISIASNLDINAGSGSLTISEDNGGNIVIESATALDFYAGAGISIIEKETGEIQFDNDLVLTCNDNVSITESGGGDIQFMGSTTISTAAGKTLSFSESDGGNFQIDNGFTVSLTASGGITITENDVGSFIMSGDGTLNTNGSNLTLTENDDDGFVMGAADSITTGNGSFTLDENLLGTMIMEEDAVINSGSGTMDIDINGDFTIGQLTTSNNTASSINIALTNSGSLIDADSADPTVNIISPGTVTVNTAGEIGAINNVIAETLFTPILTQAAVLDLHANLDIAVIDSLASDIDITRLETDGGDGEVLVKVTNGIDASTIAGIAANDSVGLVSNTGSIIVASGLNLGNGVLRLEADTNGEDITDGDQTVNVTASSVYAVCGSGVDFALGGNTTLDLDIDGPCTITGSGTITFADLDSSGNAAVISANNAGNLSVTADDTITVTDAISTGNGTISLTTQNAGSGPDDDIVINGTVTAGGTNNLSITTSSNSGEITVNNTLSASGANVILSSDSNIIYSTANRIAANGLKIITANSGNAGASGSLILTNVTNISSDVAGSLYLDENDALIVNTVDGTTGITAGTNCDIRTGGNFTRTVGSISATNLRITSGGNIGTSSANRIQTSVTNISASASGNMYILEDNAVTIATVESQSGLAVGNDQNLYFSTTDGAVTISQAISAPLAGLIDIQAGGGANDDITVNAAAGSGSGNLDLTAADSIALGANITSSADISLTASAGSITRTAGTISNADLILSAGGSIGSVANPINAQIARLEANSGGDIYLDDTGSLTIGGIGATTGVSSSGSGAIRLGVADNIIINEDITSGGVKTIIANNGGTADTGSITGTASLVNGSAVLSAASGINISMSGVTSLNGTNSASGNINITQGSDTALTVVNLVNSAAASDLTLSNNGGTGANVVISTGLVQAPASVQITSTGNVNDHNANTDLDLSGASINISALNIGNTQELDIDGATSLTLVSTASPGTVNVRDTSGEMAVTSISSGGAGDITINASGNITRAGAGTHLACGGTLSITTSGNIGLINDVFGDLSNNAVYLPLDIDVGSGSFSANSQIALNDVGAGSGPVNISNLTTTDANGQVLIQASTKDINQTALTGISSGDDLGLVADAGSIVVVSGLTINELRLEADAAGQSIVDSDVGTVDLTVSSLYALCDSGIDFDLGAAASVNLDLGGASSITANGTITLDDIILPAGDDAALISGNFTVTTDAGSGGNIVIDDPLTATGALVVLNSDGAISRQNTADITAASLKLLANGAGGTSATPLLTDVTTFAADAEGAIYLQEINAGGALVIGTVDGISGITTSNDAVDIQTLNGTITVSQAILAGTGAVTLNADGGNISLGANINASGSKGAVTLDSEGTINWSAGRVYAVDCRLLADTSIGAVNPNEIKTEADNLQAVSTSGGVIYIDELDNVDVGGGALAGSSSGGNFLVELQSTGGSITISENIDSGTARINLRANGSISRSSGELQSGSLLLAAGGHVGENWTNRIPFTAETLEVASGDTVYLEKTDANNLTIADLDAAATGIDAPLHIRIENANPNSLIINQPVESSGAGDIRLDFGNGIDINFVCNSSGGNISLYSADGTISLDANLDTTGNIIIDADTDSDNTNGAITCTALVQNAASADFDAAQNISCDMEAVASINALTQNGNITLTNAATGSVTLSQMRIVGAGAAAYTQSGNQALDITSADTTGGAAGNITINNSGGSNASINLDLVQADTVNDTISLTAGGAINPDSTDAAADIIAFRIDLDSADGGIGNTQQLDIDAVSRLSAVSSYGPVSLEDTAGDLPIFTVDAGSENVSLVSAGGIVDLEDTQRDIIANALNLSAVSGIGSTNALEITAASLQAVNSSSGNIQLNELNALRITGSGIQNQAGTGLIDLVCNGQLDIDAPVRAQGNTQTITINSGTGSTRFNVDSGADSVVQSNSGNITLAADCQLLENTLIDSESSSAGNITFSGSINGAFNLDIAAGTGNVNFNNSIGNTTALANLDVQNAANLNFTNTVDITSNINAAVSADISTTAVGAITAGGVLDFSSSGGGASFAAALDITGNTRISTETDISTTAAASLDTGGSLSLTSQSRNISLAGTVGGTDAPSSASLEAALDISLVDFNAAGNINLTSTTASLNGDILTTADGHLELRQNGLIQLMPVSITLDGPFHQYNDTNTAVTASASLATTNDPIRFESEVRFTDRNTPGSASWSCGPPATTAEIILDSDLHIYAPQYTLDIESNITVNNLVLYSGELNLHGRNLTSVEDLVLFGAGPAAAYYQDATTGLDLFAYDHTVRTDNASFPGNIMADPNVALIDLIPGPGISFTLPDDFGGTVSGLAVAGYSSTITVGGNFYNNYCDLTTGGDSWFINISPNNSQDQRFAEAYNCSVSHSQLTGGGYIAASENVSLTNCNEGWDDQRPEITSAYTVYDDVIRLEFNKPLENSNNEIWEAVVESGLLWTNEGGGSPVAFTAAYLDAECTQTTSTVVGDGDSSNDDPSVIYVRAAQTWNTDADGDDPGTVNSTDRGRVGRAPQNKNIIPDIRIDKASLARHFGLLGHHKNRHAHNYYNQSVEDHCGPALISVQADKMPHDSSNYQTFDAHNRFTLRYSEPVSFGNQSLGADFQLNDGDANIRSDRLFSTDGTAMADITSSGGNVTVSGFFSYPGELNIGSRDGVSPNSLYYNDEYSLSIYVAAYAQATSNAQQPWFWPGFIISADDPLTKTVSPAVNSHLQDKSPNQNVIEDFNSTYESYPVVITQGPTAAVWDIDPPSFVLYEAPSIFEAVTVLNINNNPPFLDRLELYVIDNSSSLASWDSELHPFNDDQQGVRDSSFYFDAALNSSPDFFLVGNVDSADQPNADYNAGFDTAVTNFLFTEDDPIEEVDDNYFSLLLANESWDERSTLYFRHNDYDNSDFPANERGYITDLAGNLLRHPEDIENMQCLERNPPRIEFALAIAGESQVYIYFAEAVFNDRHLGVIPDNADVSTLFQLRTESGTNQFSGSLRVVNRNIQEGVISCVLPLQNSLSAYDALTAEIIPQDDAVFDLSGNSMDPSDVRQITDIGVGIINPLWGDDGVHSTDVGEDLRLGPDAFDGSGKLLDRDIQIQVYSPALDPDSAQNLNRAVSFFYDVEAPSTLTDYLDPEAWISGSPNFPCEINSQAREALGSGSEGGSRTFFISSADPEIVVGADVEFSLLFGGLPCLRVAGPLSAAAEDWPFQLRNWQFGIREVKKQRAGVTILNNVINPERNEKAIIQYEISSPGKVTVIVMTLDGSVVKVINNAPQAPGKYSYKWDGRNNGGKIVAKGLYFIRVSGPGIDEIRKVMVVK